MLRRKLGEGDRGLLKILPRHSPSRTEQYN